MHGEGGEAPAAPRPAQGAEDVVPPYDDYVGRQVRKKFDGYGTFLGTVESVKGAVRPYFTVRYDDGDEEQVTKGELKLILVPLGVASATVPMVANGPPVKRQVGWVLPGSGMSSGDATTDASRRAGEAAMEETSVRRGRMRAGEWRKWWNPSDKSPMVELVERNAPVAYRDGGGAECEEQVLAPTHALLLGQGEGGTAWHAGPWEEMAPRLAGYFDAQREKQWVMPSSPPPRRAQAAAGASAVGGGTAAVAAGEALIDFRNLRVSYGSHVVFDGGLSWLVREGEKWVVHGGNGTGKSTLVELITGENVLGYAQEHLHLFGRQKGSGESIWQIKAQLGAAAWPRVLRPTVAHAATTAPEATRFLGATLLAREDPTRS